MMKTREIRELVDVAPRRGYAGIDGEAWRAVRRKGLHAYIVRAAVLARAGAARSEIRRGIIWPR
jgi:hypothetical protein